MTRSFARLGAAALIATALVLFARDASAQDTDETPSMSPAAAKQIIQARARLVINALQAKNTVVLASFVHPVKGLRFSPYTYINKDTDRVFKVNGVKGLAASQRRYY